MKCLLQDHPSSELENTAEDGGASSSTVKGETLTEEAQSSTDVDVEQKRSMDDTAATAVHTDTVDQVTDNYQLATKVFIMILSIHNDSNFRVTIETI